MSTTVNVWLLFYHKVEWAGAIDRGSLARKHFTFCGQFLHRYSPFIAYWGESKTNFCPCRNALLPPNEASDPSFWELIIFHPSVHFDHSIHDFMQFIANEHFPITIYMNFHTYDANIFIFTNMDRLFSKNLLTKHRSGAIFSWRQSSKPVFSLNSFEEPMWWYMMHCVWLRGKIYDKSWGGEPCKPTVTS